MPKNAQKTAQQNRRTTARLLALGVSDPNLQQQLIHAGLTSAHRISSASRKELMKLLGSDLGKQVHKKAKQVTAAVHSMAHQLRQQTSPHLRTLSGSTLAEATEAAFAADPSYDQLFGGIDYCEVPEGRSIYSAGAYLIDLFRLMGSTMDQGSVADYQFDNRRPDINEIVVNEANTTNLIPKLEIVNNVLQKRLLAMSDETGYEDDDSLTSLNYPMVLPANINLTELRQLADLLHTTVAELWSVTLGPIGSEDSGTGAPNDNTRAIARESVNISQSQYNLLTSDSNGNAAVQVLYGQAVDQNYNDEDASVSTAELIGLTDIDMNQLNRIIYGETSLEEQSSGVTGRFYVNIEIPDSFNPQEDPMVVASLSDPNDAIQFINPVRLCEINRLIRIANITDWDVVDVDWVLATTYYTLYSENQPYSIVRDGIPFLAFCQQWSAAYRISVNQAVALFGPMKDYGEANGPSFLESVFGETLAAGTASWDYTDPQSENWGLLKQGLNLDDDDMTVLGVTYADWFGATGNTIVLTHEVLASAYRASMLTQLLRMSLTEVLFLLSQIELSAGQSGEYLLKPLAEGATYYDRLAILDALQTTAVWYHANHLTYDTLRYVLLGTADSDVPGLATPPVDVVRQAVTAEEALDFQQQLTANEADPEVAGARLAGFTALPSLNAYYTIEDHYGFYYPVYPDVNPVAFMADMQDVGYANANGIALAVPQLDSDGQFTQDLPELQAYVNAMILENAEPHSLSELIAQLEKVLTTNALQARFLAYFTVVKEAGKATSLFAGALMDLFEENEKITTEMLRTLPLQLVNLNLVTEHPSGQVPAVNTADYLFEDLMLSGYINRNGKVLSQPNARLTAMQAYMKDQLGMKAGAHLGRVITKLENTVLDDENMATDQRFLTYLRHIDNASATFANELVNLYAAADDNQQAAFNHTLGGFLEITDNAVMESNLYDWVNTLLGTDPIPYFMQEDAESAAYIDNLDRLRRMATAFQSLSWNEHTTGWWVSTQTSGVVSDLSALTQASGVQTVTNQFDDQEGEVVESLMATTLTSAAQLLSDATGWTESDIESLMNLWYSSPTAISGSDLAYLFATFTASVMTTLSVDTLQAIATSRTYDSNSQFDTVVTSVRAALKSNYASESSWNEMYEPVEVVVNEYRRDAYASLLIYGCSKSTTLQEITTYRQLSEYLCTDIQVTGLIETSEVAEAMRALQFFINRAAMGLEPNVTFTDEEEFRIQWEWMSSYRIWEANRKVFVNAENYVSPDLLPVQTEAYTDLKNTLQGNNIDDALISEAYGTYLDDFMKVANLTTVASFLDEMNTDAEGNEYQYLYLIGRTRQEPYDYYWRKARVTHSANDQVLVQWEPWTPTGLKLPHVSNVSAIFAFNRLFLFWPEFVPGPRENNEQRIKGTLKYSSFVLAADRWSHPQEANRQIMISRGVMSLNEANLHWSRVALEVKTVSGEELLYFSNITGNGFLDRHFVAHALQTGFPDIALPNNLVEFNPGGTAYTPGLMGPYSYQYITVSDDDGTRPVLQYFQVGGHLQDMNSEEVNLSSYTFYCRFRYLITSPIHVVPVAGSLDAGTQSLLFFKDPSGSRLACGTRIEESGTTLREANTIELCPLSENANIWQEVVVHVTMDGDVNDPDSTATYHSVNSAFPNQPVSGTAPAALLSVFNRPKDLAMGVVPTGTPLDPVTQMSSCMVFPGYVEMDAISNLIEDMPAHSNVLHPMVSIANTDQADELPVGWEAQHVWRSGKEESPGGEMPEVVKVRNASGEGALINTEELFLNEATFSAWIKPMGDNSDARTVLQWQGLDTRPDMANHLTNALYLPEGSSELRLSLLGGTTADQSETLVEEALTELETGEWYLINYAVCHRTFELNASVFDFEVQVRDSEMNVVVAKQFTYRDTDNWLTWCSRTPKGGISLFGMDCAFSNFSIYAQSEIDLVRHGAHYQQRIAATHSPEELFGNLPRGASFDSVILHDSLDTPWYILHAQDSEYLLAANYLTGGNNDTYSAIRLDSPAASELSGIFLADGTKGLLSLPAQNTEESDFDALQPTNLVSVTPSDTVDLNGANGIYYNELWFFSPWLIANMLATGQDYEAAKTWFEYVYNPTAGADAGEEYGDEYWNFKGLRTSENPILKVEHERTASEELQSELGGVPVPSNLSADALQLAEALNTYLSDPFDADAVADLRPLAYQKALVMAYVNNLLNWGDLEFTQNTRESINEAGLIYMTGLDLLGRKPEDTGMCPMPETQTVQDLLDQYSSGDIPEFLIGLEDTLALTGVSTALNATTIIPGNYIADAYFGTPENDRFASLWDTLQQRLYNIRHNLDINGELNHLPLFAPELNPADIKALIGGAGSGTGYASANTAIPVYRYEYLLEKAKGFTQMVNYLGSALLSALEKKDAQHLSDLLASQQITILDLTEQVRQDAIDAAQYNIQALNESLNSATYRENHFKGLISDGLNSLEIGGLAMNALSAKNMAEGTGFKLASALIYIFPNLFGASNGGSKLSEIDEQVGNTLESAGWTLNNLAGMLGIQAGYQRRLEDWTLQAQLAMYDVAQINDQLEEANLALSQAQQDLSILQTETAQQEAILGYYQSKFTSEELYNWMAGQLSSLYYQSFQLAVEMAEAAKRAMQFQLGSTVNLPLANTWNNHKKGLLAGEALMNSLNQLDQYYTVTNVRRKEMSKSISLKDLSGAANAANTGQFERLLETGECDIFLTEDLFDLDYPGDYCRQITSLMITIPALLGPYQNLHAELTQTLNRLVLEDDISAVRELLNLTDPSDPVTSPNIRTSYLATSAICISNPVIDSGVFTVNFNDPRYLPFEGSGAVSNWHLSLPLEQNLPLVMPKEGTSMTPGQTVNFANMQLNLSDVIIEVHYTVLTGNDTFSDEVWNEVAPTGYTWTGRGVVPNATEEPELV